jgi:hypothetical protein
MKNLVDGILELEKQLMQVSEATLNEAGKLGVETIRATDLFRHGANFDNQVVFYAHNQFEGEVVSEAPYSEYLEFGNNEGGEYIYPVNAKALHFYVNGEEIFAKKVRSHAGYFFAEKASEVVEEALPEIWETEFNKVIK